MSHTWDPQRYLAFADERGRPFVELVSRIGASEPETVVDLGCGPGNLTSLLADRWPDAMVTGIDSSETMIRAASDTNTHAHLAFRTQDLRHWLAEGSDPVDVLVSNATLQWVPGHLDLVPALLDGVRPGGWLAFQVPGNFDEPSHTLRDEVAAEPRFREHTRGVATPDAHDAATYLRALQQTGRVRDVDAWETTYLHVLHGADPVFTWISGTGARPTLQALPDDLRPDYEAELKARLRAAYPDTGHGVVLPFRRVFVVAQCDG